MVTLFTNDSLGVQITSGITSVAFVGLFIFDQYNTAKNSSNNETVSDAEFFNSLQSIISIITKALRTG